MTDSKSEDWDPGLYDERHSFVWKLASSLIELLEPQAGERILDLGCGTGQLTAQIAEAGTEIIGLDYSVAMIEEARRLYPQLRFEIGDAHDFRFEEPFDAVFSNAVLHWITDPIRVAQCISKCLKPNGRLVVEFGGKGNVRCVAKAAKAASTAVVGREIDHPWYFPSVGEFSSILETAGLEVTQAFLFDRPTLLDGNDGLRTWIRMFGKNWLAQVPPERLDDFFELLEANARPELLRDGQWYADYRRIRVVAKRVEPATSPS